MTGSASEGAQSSSRAIATSSVEPPQSSTRVNSQTRPSETAKVERSWPTETTTSAASDGGASAGSGSPQRAQQRERLEVDPGQPHAGLLAGGDVAVDQLAVGDDEQDPAHELAVVVGPLAEDVVVEHGLLDRNRQRLLGAVSGSRSRAASGRRCRRSRRCGRRCGCWRCRAGRPGAEACACGRTPSAPRRAARARAARRRRRSRARARSRATWTSSGWPLLTIRAAASCEPPILRPTRRFVRLLDDDRLFSRLRRGLRGSLACDSGSAFATTGSLAAFLRPNGSEISFFRPAPLRPWAPSAPSPAWPCGCFGLLLGLRRNEISFFSSEVWSGSAPARARARAGLRLDGRSARAAGSGCSGRRRLRQLLVLLGGLLGLHVVLVPLHR